LLWKFDSHIPNRTFITHAKKSSNIKTCLHFFFFSIPFRFLSHFTHFFCCHPHTEAKTIRSTSLSRTTSRKEEEEGGKKQGKMNYVLLFHLLCVFILFISQQTVEINSISYSPLPEFYRSTANSIICLFLAYKH
jgi:hypothetical protein